SNAVVLAESTSGGHKDQHLEDVDHDETSTSGGKLERLATRTWVAGDVCEAKMT
ncbi:unnamed protein product, partial [Amoebophrya sp. A25]